MKRLISRLVFFILIFGLLYPLFLFIWAKCFSDQDMKPNLFFKPASYGHTFTRLQEADTTKNVDILFLGSSHAYRGFNTVWFNALGYRVLNLGSSSQSHLQTAQLLNRYLSKCKPQCIVYEVYYPVFSVDGSESAVDLHSNTAPDLAGLAEVFLTGNLLACNTYFFSWPYTAWNYNDTITEKRRVSEDTYFKGGYVEKDFRTFKYIKHRDTIIELCNVQKAVFCLNLRRIRAAGIPVLLVQAPVTKALYQSYLNADEVDKWLALQGEYINFNTNSGLDDSLCFYDPHHLNSDGVKVFNERLLQEIRARYKFKGTGLK